MEINKLEKNNNLELDNKIKNNKTQKDFLESALGKTINTAIDIGISGTHISRTTAETTFIVHMQTNNVSGASIA